MRERRAGNARAGWSVVAGLLSVIALPAAVAATRWSDRYELLHAGIVIPVAGALGVVALVLTRAARARNDRTLGRAGGLRTAAWGRGLGIAGLALAAAAAIAIGVYALLRWLETA
jgi:hypothetical protein